MYESILGDVIRVLPGSLEVRAGGIGYCLIVPMAVSSELKRGMTERFLLHHDFNTNTGVSTLFGFKDEYQRGMFRALLNVKKIGPATAMKILVAIDPRELAGYIRSGDAAALARVRGLGKQSAEHCIVELKDKIDDYVSPDIRDFGDGPGEAAVQALCNLGEKRGVAKQRVEKALKSFHGNADGPGPRITVEAVVKVALGV